LHRIKLDVITSRRFYFPQFDAKILFQVIIKEIGSLIIYTVFDYDYSGRRKRKIAFIHLHFCRLRDDLWGLGENKSPCKQESIQAGKQSHKDLEFIWSEGID
jgi:hypothetical protein